MPLRGLRANRSERDLNRRSTLEPTALFKKGSSPADHADDRTGGRIAVSEDGGRPHFGDVGDIGEDSSPSPSTHEPTPKARRFSLMRFRHASDSHLSLKAKEHADSDAPPVPAVPATSIATPSIITTAPTIVDHDEPTIPRKRGRMQQFSLRRRSLDPSSSQLPGLRKSMDKKHSADIKRGPFSFMRSQNALIEEPGRLSISEAPDTLVPSARGTAQEGASSLSLSVPRASESSRSDASSGVHISFEHTPRPRTTPKSSTSLFSLGRKKQRASLFPIPMKVTTPQFPNTAPATPRASTSGVSSGSPHHSPGGESPPLTAINHNRVQKSENGTTTPPHSSSQFALAAASLNDASGGDCLLRNDSIRSVRSAHSSPNRRPNRLALRGRSSTMGSLGARSEDVPPPTPPYIASGRTSTSTAGRSSFSNLFNLGARFRQNPETYSPRHGSPAHGFSGNSGPLSQQNSLNISREALVLPDREEGETPGHYLERLEENNIDKSVIASLLTKKDDAFLLAVLRSYMRKFAFFGDPIDMAIRKLLMQVELPKETQQIDRVLQGFADRYHECNPGIYINPDKAYFISFSIVILHTDFFNKNNKRKMQRNDYIKNSSCEGVSEDVLGCIYDNIVYTPFIHIEDEVDLKNIASRRSKKSAVLKGSLHDPAKKAVREPLDPYTLILEGKLDILRPNIKDVMNLDDPYGYLGSAPTLDIRNLYKSFARYGVLQIVSSRSRPEAFMSQSSQENPLDSSVGIVEMPVTKIGVLWRKDTKRKKARSPWQEWGAVLTRSGLSLFRNSSWAKNLMHQHDQHEKHGDGTPVVFQPPLHEFKQDHIIPMDGAVALVDNTYKKHKNAFVIFSKAGEETFLADNEKDLNDWLGMINYSAAFETLGVRPRGLIGALYDGQRHRGIRRLESSHSTTSVSTPTGEVTIQRGRIDKQFAQQIMSARRELMQKRISESEERLTQCIKQLETQLRDARHLQILAPIQPKTRDLLIHAAGRLSAKLKWSRIEIWRMKCHRDILAQELQEEKQSTGDLASQNERLDTTSPLVQQQLSPLPAKKPSKIVGLTRLTSKTSSHSGSQKPPPSPTVSIARPGTKSSRDTEIGGDDAFKTPPETSRQPSPSHLSAPYAHMPVTPQSLHCPEPMTSSSTQSPKLTPFDRRLSTSSIGGGTLSSDDRSDVELRYETPPPIEPAKTDRPSTPESAPTNGLHLDGGSDSEADRPPAALTGSPESRSKVRRSLHRTLRDSHAGSSHRRGHKTRDSASTIVSDDTHESEGLARRKGSFTLHGKKASVITFGLDWQNMSAEERLKMRKQAHEALETGSAEDKEDGTRGRSHSIATASTGTILTSPRANDQDDPTPRPSPDDIQKKRHVSSQTITPANYRASSGAHDSDARSMKMEMSGIEEEATSKSLESAAQEKPTGEKANLEQPHIENPNSQAGDQKSKAPEA